MEQLCLLHCILGKGYTGETISICRISSNMAKASNGTESDTNAKKCIYKPTRLPNAKEKYQTTSIRSKMLSCLTKIAHLLNLKIRANYLD